MKLINKGLSILTIGISLLATSCASESPWSNGDSADGKISIDILTDGYVSMGTRAEDSDSYAIIPDKSKFSIGLKSTDGSYNKTWETIDAFTNEKGFPIGNYIISAYYGDISKEGFERPYYYGESQIQVKLNETTNVSITDTLSNSMVSVKYSDELKSMYKGYNASLQTEGHERVVFAYNETRPAYMYPGTAQLYITLTNNKDENVTLNPTALVLSARHHYVVTLGVNTDNLGNQSLDINVTEDIFEEEPITINLTDDLFGDPAPTVTASDFNPEETIEIFETLTSDLKEPEMHVLAIGGIKSAILTLTASEGGKLPVTGADTYEVDLVNAGAEIQSNLEAMGIKAFGFYNNVDKGGVINFGGFLKNLSEGSFTASLVVKDTKGKTSIIESEPPVTLKAKITGINYEISGAIQPKYLDKEIVIAISTNCADLKELFTFTANNKDGGISSVNAVELSANDTKPEVNTNLNHTYYYKLSVDEINDNQWKVGLNYEPKGKIEKDIDVILPQFTVETDAFARRVKIRITGESDEMTKILLERLAIKNGKGLISNEYKIDRTSLSDQNIILVTGLSSSTDYSDWYFYLGNKTSRSDYNGTPVSTFITEEELDVPNGDFEDLEGKHFIGTNVYRSGPYTATNTGVSAQFQNTANFEIKEATHWGTSNMITMNNKTNHTSIDNTWFNQPSVFNSTLTYSSTVPPITFLGGTYFAGDTQTPDYFNSFSAYSGSNAMVIRNVGWDNNGKVPSKDQDTKSWGGYFNRTVPTISNHTSGKMYLCMDNGVESNPGYVFSSRPSKLTGWYYYINDSQDQDEYGIVDIKILDSNDNTIADGSFNLTSSSQYNQFTINLNYKIFGSQPKNLYIHITSSNHPDGDEIKVSTFNSQYETYQYGATLVVDNFEFVYE